MPLRTGLLAALTLPLLAACGGGGTDAVAGAGKAVAESALAEESPAGGDAAHDAPAQDAAEAKAFTPQDLVSTTCLPGVTVAEALARLNAARAQGRLCGTTWYPPAAPLRWNEALARAAGGHSADMAAKGYFSHTGSDGSTLGTRAQAQGYAYSYLGENIAAGRSAMETTLASWLQSPGHCRNIMSARFKDYGLGCAYNASAPYRTYWTQMFGTPR